MSWPPYHSVLLSTNRAKDVSLRSDLRGPFVTPKTLSLVLNRNILPLSMGKSLSCDVEMDNVAPQEDPGRQLPTPEELSHIIVVVVHHYFQQREPTSNPPPSSHAPPLYVVGPSEQP